MTMTFKYDPKKELNEYLKGVKYKLALQLSITFTLIFAVLTIAHFFESIENLILMGAGFIICSFGLIYTYWTKNPKLVYWTYSILGVNVVGFTLNFVPTVTHYGDFIWMFSAIALAFYGLPQKVAYTILVLAIIYIGTFTIHGLNENILIMQPRNNFQKFSLFLELVSGLGSGIYIVYLMTKFYRYSEKSILAANEELRLQNDMIIEQDKEKSTLVKEVHHRVKNNLQIISSLLRMQSNEIEHHEAKAQFEEAVNRVMTMALIHQKLYQGNSLSNIKPKEYFEELAFDIMKIHNSRKNISIDFNISIEQIGLKSIVPVGLIFNELISNSFKHAFNDQPNGVVSLNFTKTEENYTMIYKDSGYWKNSESNGFGLELIDTLTQQLDGTFELSKLSDGTTYTFQFKDLSE